MKKAIHLSKVLCRYCKGLYFTLCCLILFANTSTGQEIIFYEEFASNSNNWTLGPQWQIGPATSSSGQVYGYPDPSLDATSNDNNGIAGVMIGGNAPFSFHDFYFITSPNINTNVPGSILLQFKRWLNSDYTPFMQNTLDVFNGTTWVSIWTSGSTGIVENSWSTQRFDVTAYKNSAFKVRFGFRIFSAGVYTVSSWNLDDIVISVGDVLAPYLTITELPCDLESLVVPFVTSYSFNSGNIFTAQLSDASGNFSSPVTIGSVAGTSSGSLMATIPDNIPAGTGYRIRIVTSNPVMTGADNGADITIGGAAPDITAINTSVDPQAVGAPIPIQILFTGEAVSGSIDWGDGSPLTEETLTGNEFSASHTYLVPGVYTLQVNVTGLCQQTAIETYEYLVIYDPTGGFVTGGGWFISPAGAFIQDLSASGKASFGFVAKYKKGSTVPEGNTDFQFHAADMKFKSTQYEWLVIAGSKAMYRGVGELNGAPGYGFLISAIDGDKKSSASPDKFRIKIWDASLMVVYDNQMGATEDAEAAMILGGGSIVIHDGKSNFATTTSGNTTSDYLMEAGVSAYPNPFSKYFTVLWMSASKEDLTMRLIDLAGRTIYEKVHPHNESGAYELNINEEGSVSGPYILTIRQGPGAVFLKLLRR